MMFCPKKCGTLKLWYDLLITPYSAIDSLRSSSTDRMPQAANLRWGTLPHLACPEKVFCHWLAKGSYGDHAPMMLLKVESMVGIPSGKLTKLIMENHNS
jgi:hypothetical protein